MKELVKGIKEIAAKTFGNNLFNKILYSESSHTYNSRNSIKSLITSVFTGNIAQICVKLN